MTNTPRAETLTRLHEIVFDKVMEVLRTPSVDSGAELFETFAERLDRELNHPFRLSANSEDSSVLRVENNVTQTGDQGGKFFHHESPFADYPKTTIDFSDGSVSGGFVTSAGAPFSFPATTAGEFRNMVFVYQAEPNAVDVIFSTSSSSVSGLDDPNSLLLDNPHHRIGYMPVESLGGGAFASPGSVHVRNEVSGEPTIFRFHETTTYKPELLRVVPSEKSIQINSGILPLSSGQQAGIVNGESEVLAFQAGSVDFSTGTVSGGLDFTPYTPTVSGHFYRYGVGLSNDNEVQVSLPLINASTENLAPYPLFTNVDVPVCVVTMQDDGSGLAGSINNISNSDILKFEGLGGSAVAGTLGVAGITENLVSSALVVASGETWTHPNSTIEAPVVINGTYINLGASGIINSGGSITMGPGSQTKQISYDS